MDPHGPAMPTEMPTDAEIVRRARAQTRMDRLGRIVVPFVLLEHVCTHMAAEHRARQQQAETRRFVKRDRQAVAHA